MFVSYIQLGGCLTHNFHVSFSALLLLSTTVLYFTIDVALTLSIGFILSISIVVVYQAVNYQIGYLSTNDHKNISTSYRDQHEIGSMHPYKNNTVISFIT